MAKMIGVSLSRIVCDIAGPVQVAGSIFGATNQTSRRDIFNFSNLANAITVDSSHPAEVDSPMVRFEIGDPAMEGDGISRVLRISGDMNIGTFPPFTVDLQTKLGRCHPLTDTDPPPTPFPVQINGEVTLVLTLCVLGGS